MTRTLTEKLALSILADNGIAAIWRLHMAATHAHQTGHQLAAGAILQIAKAAEAAWLRAEGGAGARVTEWRLYPENA
jgi:hypothetical protein